MFLHTFFVIFSEEGGMMKEEGDYSVARWRGGQPLLRRRREITLLRNTQDSSAADVLPLE